MDNHITIVRGVEPDVDNGGSLVDGIIIGPKLCVSRWRIGEDNSLYDNRPAAEKEVKRRNLNAEIFSTLGLANEHNIKPSDVARLIRCHGKALKNILISKKYAPLLG